MRAMGIPDFPGWQLLGAFPDGESDDVGSWLLADGREAMLLEVPPGLTPSYVLFALERANAKLCFVTASHDHEDHLDADAWRALEVAFPRTRFIHPQEVDRLFTRGDLRLTIGSEPLWLVKAPKHSRTDIVTVFRGVAMTGDIELGTLDSVNREVPKKTKAKSMEWLAAFQDRTGYLIHFIVSAHLNDFRLSVDWPALFRVS